MAVCIPIEDFRARFPEFINVPDATITLYIGDACDILSETAFGDICYPKAVAYHAAHHIAVSVATTEKAPVSGAAEGTPAGGITGSGADGLSVSFGGLSPESESQAFYGTTAYGKQFMVLSEECVDITSVVTPRSGGCGNSR